MATVFLRGKKWVAQWYRADGTRVKRATGCEKRREAEREAADMENKDRKAESQTGRKFEEIMSRVVADAKAGKLSADRAADLLTEIRQVADPDFKVVSLEDHLTGWCAEKTARVKSKTSANYLDMKRRFAAALGAATMRAPVAELERQQIEAAMRKMKKGGLVGATVNLDLRALRQALKQAHEDGLVTRNAAAGIKPLPEDDSAERAPFTAAEVQAMMGQEKTTEEWRGMILFGAHTGLRMGDVARLGRGFIEDGDLVIRPTKTSRSRKVIRIPLSKPLLDWTKDRIGAFFPTAAKTSVPTLSMQFSAIMKRAKVPAAVTLTGGIEAKRSFHSLRHSFTSWLAEADIPEDVRQKLTGHADKRSHAKYTHHDAALARAVATLPDLPSARTGA